MLQNPLPSLLLSAAMLLASTPSRLACAQQIPDLSELEEVALAELKETRIPGAAMVVVSGDRAVFLKGLGVASIETGVPITPDTLFSSGVLSKIFIAIAVVSLADEGRIDLGSPVGTYVKGLSPQLSRVTVHQLLSQTAGITEEHLPYSLWSDSALGTAVRSWKDDRVFSEPGRIFSSSHQTYDLAGLLLEEITGKPFADVVSEKVFNPLGMSRSTFRPLMAMTYPFSQGHESVGAEEFKLIRPLTLNSVGWPSVSLFTSVHDLSRFLIAFVNGGRLDGHQVLPASVIATLSKAYVAYPAAVGQERGYGTSFSSYGNHRLLSSSTIWAGVAARMWIVPERRFAMIIMVNGYRNEGNALRKTAAKALQMFLPLQVRPETNANQILQMTKAEASGYVGTYENERVIKLSLKDNGLFMRDETTLTGLGNLTSGEELPVTKVGDHYFAITPPGASQPTTFALITGESGKVEYLHIGNRALRRR